VWFAKLALGPVIAHPAVNYVATMPVRRVSGPPLPGKPPSRAA
jgi:hypothetical protein